LQLDEDELLELLELDLHELELEEDELLEASVKATSSRIFGVTE
jgi:hypothetical protein